MPRFFTIILLISFIISPTFASDANQQDLPRKPLVCMVEDQQADIKEFIEGRLFFKADRKVADDETLALQKALVEKNLPVQFAYHKNQGGYVTCFVTKAFGDYEAFTRATAVNGRLLNHSVPLLTGKQMEIEDIPDYDIGLIYRDVADEKHYFWLRMAQNIYVKSK